MARKVSKTICSKGERLGWSPLDRVSHAPLSSIKLLAAEYILNRARKAIQVMRIEDF